ncbi:MAG: serine/threonine protein kinase [Candidatus Riflebacteria bacterium]|nr:serine/threonine protein kinase [Candidatus Riflebacteria bacterium]
MGNEQMLVRAEREVTALRMCKHQNIPKVFDFELTPARGYVAIELIDGKNLDELIEERGKPLSNDQIFRIARAVAGALAFCHARGLFHRDIKPANIVIEKGTGRTALLDFGIVKAVNLRNISLAGNRVMGTFCYLAPEQVMNWPVDQRTDIYQLALVIYKMVTALDPPPSTDLDTGTLAFRLGAIPSLNPHAPSTMQNFLNNCLRLNAARRYPTVHDMLDGLDRLEKGLPVEPLTGKRAAPPTPPLPTAGPPPKQESRPVGIQAVRQRVLKKVRDAEAIETEATETEATDSGTAGGAPEPPGVAGPTGATPVPRPPEPVAAPSGSVGRGWLAAVCLALATIVVVVWLVAGR